MIRTPSNTSLKMRRTGIRTWPYLLFLSPKQESRLVIISKHVIFLRFLKKTHIKSCHLKAVNSLIKWYHANSRFGLASNLLLKPFYLTRDFDICSCHWLLKNLRIMLKLSDFTVHPILDQFWSKESKSAVRNGLRSIFR